MDDLNRKLAEAHIEFLRRIGEAMPEGQRDDRAVRDVAFALVAGHYCRWCGQYAYANECSCEGKEEKRLLNETVDEVVFNRSLCREAHAQSGSWCMSCPNKRKAEYVPAYSTDPVAALSVVREMYRRGISVDWPVGRDEIGFHAGVNAAPMSICKSALRALRGAA